MPITLALLTASCGGDHGDGAQTPLPVPLEIASVMPARDAVDVPTTTRVTVMFNQAIDESSLAASLLTLACPAGHTIATTVSYDAATHSASFTPTVALPGDTACSATLGPAVRTARGSSLGHGDTWLFATDLDRALVAQGRDIFRFDTFGDETQWTDALRMHEAIRTAVDPLTALSVGLKVDAEALPAAVVQGIQNGTIDLSSPDTTVALLKLDAVVGVKGTVENVGGHDVLTRVGITCALCHSTVDDSFAAGIGKRLDGWPNRDLNAGAIIALSPVLTPAQKSVYGSWGKGKYDPRFNFDGINGPQAIPPAFGLRGIHRITSTGDGEDIAYWNRYVAVTQMGGHGTFSEPRTGVMVTNGTDDLVSAKLPALQAYQLSLAAPPPPAASFDAAAAARGKDVFAGAARCASCHEGAELTDANRRMHFPVDTVGEPEPDGAPSYASRSATGQYRTAPLKGVWQHPPYFHNGSAATLEEVVERYNTRLALGLSAADKTDLVQYLKSL